MILLVSKNDAVYIQRVICIFQAIEQIETNGGDSARVILAITDGSWVAVLTDRVRTILASAKKYLLPSL